MLWRAKIFLERSPSARRSLHDGFVSPPTSAPRQFLSRDAALRPRAPAVMSKHSKKREARDTERAASKAAVLGVVSRPQWKALGKRSRERLLRRGRKMRDALTEKTRAKVRAKISRAYEEEHRRRREEERAKEAEVRAAAADARVEATKALNEEAASSREAMVRGAAEAAQAREQVAGDVEAAQRRDGAERVERLEPVAAEVERRQRRRVAEARRRRPPHRAAVRAEAFRQRARDVVAKALLREVEL